MIPATSILSLFYAFRKRPSPPEGRPEELFGDPLAGRIEWTPTEPGQANFKTHKLVAESPDGMAFRAAAPLYLVASLFFFPAMLCFGGAIWKWSDPWEDKAIIWFLLGFGLFFAILAAWTFYDFSRPHFFRKDTGSYWKGRCKTGKKSSIPLADIHALQLLCGTQGAVTSYELNAVLHDGRRIHILEHANRNALHADAAQLTKFLNVPLWDYT